MAQLTIYLDDVTAKQIEKAARAEHNSVSKWVKTRITHYLQKEWSEVFKKTLGALQDEDIQVPEEISFTNDPPRETL